MSLPILIDELLGLYHMYGHFNGAALAAEGEGFRYAKGFGYANLEWQIPNTTATKFRIGSLTKQFTAVLVLQSVSEGALALDQPVSSVLPYYRRDTGDRISIEQLLNHTSGIPNYTALPNFAASLARQGMATEPFVREWCSGDLEFEPGTEWSYNNSAYFMLGAILETITGTPYPALLRERILGPLDMHDTGYDLSEPLLPRRASGYDRDLEGYRNTSFLDMSLPGAAGAMYSTVEDLQRWERALYTDQLLDGAAREAMFRPGLGNYGYGWVVLRLAPANLGRMAEPFGATMDDGGELITAHGGSINGFNSTFVRMTGTGRFVTLLNNTGVTCLQRMALDILRIMYGLPYELPRQPAAPLLYALTVDQGIDRALAQYRAWREADDGRVDTGETELLRLARHCLSRARIADAGAAYGVAVELFGSSLQPQLEQAEWYAAAGRRDDAVRALERILAERAELPTYARRQLGRRLERLRSQA